MCTLPEESSRGSEDLIFTKDFGNFWIDLFQVTSLVFDIIPSTNTPSKSSHHRYIYIIMKPFSSSCTFTPSSPRTFRIPCHVFFFLMVRNSIPRAGMPPRMCISTIRIHRNSSTRVAYLSRGRPQRSHETIRTFIIAIVTVAAVVQVRILFPNRELSGRYSSQHRPVLVDESTAAEVRDG